MNIKYELVEKISKAGNPYKCLELTIGETVKKIVFLSQAELELLKYKK